MRSRFLLTFLTIALGLAPPLLAEEMLLRLDPEQTDIEFELGATLHTVHGTARLVEGEVRFDPRGGEASGRIVVDATSADTGNEGRDEDMHTKVLDSERFGRITFRPTRLLGPVALEGESTVEIEGSFEIHGSEHPLTAVASVRATGDPAAPQVGLTVAFEVPYVAWGMKDPSKFLLKVAKSVDVELTATGSLEPLGGEAGGDPEPEAEPGPR